jgi:hypothetical protein
MNKHEFVSKLRLFQNFSFWNSYLEFSYLKMMFRFPIMVRGMIFTFILLPERK